MKPSNEALDAQARHLANSVFAIGTGAIMLAASLPQTIADPNPPA